MTAGIDAAGDVQVDLADIEQVVQVVEAALDGFGDRDRLGVGQGAEVAARAADDAGQQADAGLGRAADAAFLVIAMVVTPGATAYLLTDRFPRLLALAVAIGAGTSALGAYLSYFLDGATGGIIVLLQTALFVAAFVLAPTHGLLAARARARAALKPHPAARAE